MSTLEFHLAQKLDITSKEPYDITDRKIPSNIMIKQYLIGCREFMRGYISIGWMTLHHKTIGDTENKKIRPLGPQNSTTNH
jgi:hypothetical protein